MSVSKTILIGNLTKDVDVKYTGNGMAIAAFTVATNERYKDKNTGENVNKPEFHRVVAFRKLAEICGEFLHKGSKVYVEGKNTTRKWTDKNGIDRYTTEVIINEMTMLDSKGGHAQPQSQPKDYEEKPEGSPIPNDFDDDIPF